MLNQPRKRPVWPFVLMGSVLGLAALAAVGTWVYGAYSMSDPATTILAGMASSPKTSEGKRGVITLWNADDFLKTSSGAQPKTLPANLDISVTFAGVEDGTGDVFNVRKVKAAHVPNGQYWTRDGSRTAVQIDAQLNCHDSN
ncbi:hypothetical protein FNV64_49955 [Streptomyces sp. S1A1-7]|uniref:hypothetical protein n=2 Tax=unclassified Streptomyces TaxID=2593676 RepID=UPI0011657C37|nr:MULTISPECIES: hypothetical protein [unclassified Streptomyces]QDN82572.1 hypothetical protein FNV64_49955 [Streptomyces sp. S1A1-7]QDO54725.1 hypothetical protein FNV60_46750 [Streptomyces sp. RLB3-5]QDO64969.1 hypothetical protein FNV59_49005 [Streptomyces sp. RLB1-8]